jgi:hypothetical protein
MIISPIEMILICILFCPILTWHDVVYLSNEHYCYVQYTNTRSVLWLLLNIYAIPLVLLTLIYLQITMFLRRQPNNQTFIVKQRQQRDLLVIRRILITVGLLIALGFPTVVVLFMFYITGVEQPLYFRIEWLFVSLSMIGLSLSTVIFTPQLKSIVLNKFQNNRIQPFVTTVSSAIPMRHKI